MRTLKSGSDNSSALPIIGQPGGCGISVVVGSAAGMMSVAILVEFEVKGVPSHASIFFYEAIEMSARRISIGVRSLHGT